MNNINTYIFDYGGTLDTNGNHWGMVIWDAYQCNKIDIKFDDYREAYIYTERLLGKENIIKSNNNFKETLEIKIHIQVEYIKKRYNINIEEEKEKHIIEQLYSYTRSCIDKSREVLIALKQKYKLILVSNFYGNLNTVLQEFGLNKLFYQVIESANIGLRKPNPDIFMYALLSANTKQNEALVIGDSLKNDIIPAKQIGCKTIQIKGKQWNEYENNEIKADIEISDIKELIEINIS